MKNKFLIILLGFLIILLGLVLALSACNDSLDNESCYQTVREAYPKAIILTPKYGDNMNFIVIDTLSKPNTYYSVTTGSILNPNITNVTKLYIQE